MRDDKNLLDVEDVTQPQNTSAGDFSLWLRRTRSALADGAGVDVPCGTCNACCKSSYFIHIGPEESKTLSRIPKALLFPAPGLPSGNVLMGYDEKGHCPMLVDESCSIYEHRPQTCRAYDCRVFPAAGIAAGDREKDKINQRIRSWKFSYATEADRIVHSAVQAAAEFLHERADCFPAGTVPSNPTQLAVLAIKVYDVFIDEQHTSDRAAARELAKVVVDKKTQFEVASKNA